MPFASLFKQWASLPLCDTASSWNTFPSLQNETLKCPLPQDVCPHQSGLPHSLHCRIHQGKHDQGHQGDTGGGDNTVNCRHCQLSTLTTLSKVDTDNTVNCWHWTHSQLSILTTLSTVDTDKTVNCQHWTHRVCNSKTGHSPIHLSISCVPLEFISVISTFVLI